MTNEEAKTFLDNLKVCIEEHPIVADWLVEIADRKTEPQTYITEDRDTQILDAWQVHHRSTTSVEDEPQTEWEKSDSRAVLTARCLNCHNAKACKENNWQGCRFEPIEDEPQTDRSMAVGKRSDATADKYNLYGKTTTDEPQTDCAWRRDDG